MNALAGVDDSHLYWDADAGHGECDMYYPTSAAQAAGLDAAREAVAALKQENEYYPLEFHNTLAQAIAAIDALREGK